MVTDLIRHPDLILYGDTGDGGQLLLVGPVGPDQAHLGPFRQSVSAAMYTV